MRNVVAAMLAGILLLTGCNGDSSEADPPPPPPASSAAPSETGAPTEPPLPDAATARTNEGAEAFVRYWLSLSNYALRTGETGTLRALSDPGCVGCVGGAESIERLHKDNGKVTGGDLRITRLERTRPRNGGDWAATGRVSYQEQIIEYPDGRRERFGGGPGPLRIEVRWDRDAWLVRWLVL